MKSGTSADHIRDVSLKGRITGSLPKTTGGCRHLPAKAVEHENRFRMDEICHKL
jgi:hypothetical protein